MNIVKTLPLLGQSLSGILSPLLAPSNSAQGESFGAESADDHQVTAEDVAAVKEAANTLVNLLPAGLPVSLPGAVAGVLPISPGALPSLPVALPIAPPALPISSLPVALPVSPSSLPVPVPLPVRRRDEASADPAPSNATVTDPGTSASIGGPTNTSYAGPSATPNAGGSTPPNTPEPVAAAGLPVDVGGIPVVGGIVGNLPLPNLPLPSLPVGLPLPLPALPIPALPINLPFGSIPVVGGVVGGVAGGVLGGKAPAPPGSK